MAAVHPGAPSPWMDHDPSASSLDDSFDILEYLHADAMVLLQSRGTPTTPDLFLEPPQESAQLDYSTRRSHPETSPGGHTGQATAGSSSVSPGTLILTPSTNPIDSDVPLFEDHDLSDAFSASPQSNVSPVDGFSTHRFGTSSFAHGRRMNDGRRSQRVGDFSGSRAFPPLHETSVAPSTTRASTATTYPWSSFPADVVTNRQHHSQQNFLSAPASFEYGSHGAQPQFDEDILSDIEPHFSLPFRTFPDGSVAPTTSTDMMDAMSTEHHRHPPPFSFSNVQPTTFPPEAFYTQPINSDGAFMTAYAQNRSQPLYAPSFTWSHTDPQHVGEHAGQHAHASSTKDKTPWYPSTASHVHDERMLSLPDHHSQTPMQTTQQSTNTLAGPLGFSEDHQNIDTLALTRHGEQSHVVVKSETARGSIGPNRKHPDRRKGGRAKGMNLDSKRRHDINVMRKVGACWGCSLQRDQCDHEDPCTRCSMKLQRGQAFFFPCDRSTLPVLIHDFLPPSMTAMHQKQSIEDTVVREVRRWDQSNCVEIHLNCGYGPSLSWNLYEFVPATPELLYQLQYLQDHVTGREIEHHKWSPPYAMMKLNTSDAERFDNYMDMLLKAEHLTEFGWDFYMEESLVDPENFQAGLLSWMCELYLNTQDSELRTFLRDLLKLLIVTYIAGHTLTIQTDTLPEVVSRVRHTETPPGVAYKKHTSPRLANRQFKFFFSVIRNNMFDSILKNYQSILRKNHKGIKEETWLISFCVILTFAMALEEVQRTLFIQAKAQVSKKECSYEDAQRQAENACDRIDNRFELLMGLFHCKYRHRTWDVNGSFGPATPQLKDPAARTFLTSVRNEIQERRDHLVSRRDVVFAPENECLYTTRLTAKFLLPFLDLPRN